MRHRLRVRVAVLVAGVRSRSKARARLYQRERIPVVKAVLAAHPICQRCDLRDAVDVHEIKTRARGGSILELDNLAALCRRCHDFLTTHPAQAETEGWMKHSWD